MTGREMHTMSYSEALARKHEDTTRREPTGSLTLLPPNGSPNGVAIFGEGKKDPLELGWIVE